MSVAIVARALNPWRFKREQVAQRMLLLRQRDGDNCTRCRRQLRFDLPEGHDRGARIETVPRASACEGDPLATLCLTHGRCNTKEGHDTAEVRERTRIKNEVALFDRARARRRA